MGLLKTFYDYGNPVGLASVGLNKVAGTPTLGDVYEKGAEKVYNGYVGATAQSPQPGVGGPIDPNDPKARSRLVRDPQTGLFFDPSTGTTYTDGYGQTPVTNPNVAQQVATNFSTSRDFLGRARTGDVEHQRNFEQQTQLGKQLQDTIDGKAPSVAQTMLGQATDATNRRQLSAAAGVGGPNAFAARRQALQNITTQNGQANQGSAILRAKEINDAVNSKGNLLGQVSASTDRRQAMNLGSAGDFAQLANRGQESQQGLNTEADKSKKEANKRLIQTGTDFAGHFLGV